MAVRVQHVLLSSWWALSLGALMQAHSWVLTPLHIPSCGDMSQGSLSWRLLGASGQSSILAFTEGSPNGPHPRVSGGPINVRFHQ